MNMTQLVDAVATQQGSAKSDAKKIFEGLIAAIMESSAKDEEISLNRLGKFKIKDIGT